MVINLVIAVVLTLILRAARVPEGADETLPEQLHGRPGTGPGAPPAEVGATP